MCHNAALMMYKNMILPIIEYGDIYMYSSTAEYRKQLQTIQNGALQGLTPQNSIKQQNSNSVEKYTSCNT